MKKANIIHIRNNNDNAIVLCPKKKVYQDFAILIAGNSFKLLDYKALNFILDLEQTYFQFQGEKKKIKIDDAHKYGITLEYRLV